MFEFLAALRYSLSHVKEEDTTYYPKKYFFMSALVHSLAGPTKKSEAEGEQPSQTSL